MPSSRSYRNWTIGLLAAPLLLVSALTPARSQPAHKTPAFRQIQLLPNSLTLTHGNDSRHALVIGIRADGARVDLTGKAAYASADGLVSVDKNGYLHPKRVGKGSVQIQVAGKRLDLPVTVQSLDIPRVSFVRDIMPILSTAGCNAGTCHGSAKGKNGFKLSLRGYDPAFDYRALIEAYNGRRLNRAQPEESLFLLKPTQGVPHAGGLRFDTDSPEYATLLGWIRQGAEYDAGVGRASSIEVLPKRPTLRLIGEGQRVLVIAHYPDGATRDVTRSAIYTSSVPDVATASHWGRVVAERRGETYLLCRYEGQFSTTPFTVLGDRTGYRWQPQVQNNFIDRLVDQKLQHIQANPSPLASDADFLRRVYLDLTGIPPTPAETRAFLADKAPTRVKRDQVIARLLASTDYVEHWTNKWADLLQCNRKYLGARGIFVFRNWIREQIAEGRPYDQFVRELLTATGDASANPAVYYSQVINTPNAATENVTQLFLGIRFACNKCHDHPFERWTRGQHYELAAYFGRLGLKRRPGGQVSAFDRAQGEVLYPVDGHVMVPKPPYTYKDMNDSGATRREQFANWLISADNPYFARSYVNRIWSYFTGRGIIDPVDDIRNTNPPTNAALLDGLTEDFIQSGFDSRHLMQVICQSRVYQASIATNRWNDDDTLNFSHARPRRLSAEELLDAIGRATGSPIKFAGLPAGTRAAQLPDPTVAKGGFLDLFGRPQRESPCECERSSAISLGQALSLINGSTVADAISATNGRLARLLKTQPSNDQVVEEIYLATLCRRPKAKEKQLALAHLAKAANQTEGAQDLMWALINSSSFLFNR